MTLPVGPGIQTGHILCPWMSPAPFCRKAENIGWGQLHPHLPSGLWTRSMLSLLLAVGGVHTLFMITPNIWYSNLFCHYFHENKKGERWLSFQRQTPCLIYLCALVCRRAPILRQAFDSSMLSPRSCVSQHGRSKTLILLFIHCWSLRW